MRKTIMILVTALCCSFLSQAQSLDSYMWGVNSLEIYLPNNAEITSDEEVSYAAETADGSFKIYITRIEFATSDQSEMQSSLDDIAKEMDLQVVNQGHFKSKNMIGASVEGVNGSGSRYVIGVVASTSEQTSYTFLIEYAQGSSYDVDEIQKSFYQGN